MSIRLALALCLAMAGSSAIAGAPETKITPVAAADLPPGAQFTDDGNGTGSFLWQPGFEAAGLYSSAFSVSDGEFTDNESILITVEDADRAPVLDTVPDQAVAEGDLVLVEMRATDLDGDRINISLNDSRFALVNITFLNATNSTFNVTGGTNGSIAQAVFAWQTGFEDAGAITVEASATSDAVRIEVSDSGEGIAAKDLPHVFDSFYRGELSRARGTGGAGLGLAIARGFVQAHGGQIGVTSLPGQGCRFFFTIPRPAAPNPTSLPQSVISA